MDYILEVKHLGKIYHNKKGETLAVEDFNLKVKEGEFIAIVGPSGCGKSTILSILCGLDVKSRGEIVTAPDLKKGYMLQQDSLFPWLTVLDNCLLGLKIEKQLTEESKQRVIELLETYGLKEFMYHYPNSLSGGMRQRAALIRTLAVNPDILLLDEAFSALDYQTRLLVSDDVYQIIKSEHKTAIMVTHDLSEAISMADRIIVLSKRPSVVKNVYDVELSNHSNPIENRKSKEFASYYDKIWKDLDVHV